MRLAWVLAIAGCYTATSEPTISNRMTSQPRGVLTISDDSFGPLRKGSSATLAALRASFPGYEVRAANDTTLSYSVYLNDEKLIWVIPNDDGTLFNAHATSPRVETLGHDWRVGSAFQDSRYVTHCECWGENPTCYRQGDHIAVNFKRGCDSLTGSVGRETLRALDGELIQRVIWSPTAFRYDSDEESLP